MIDGFGDGPFVRYGTERSRVSRQAVISTLQLIVHRSIIAIRALRLSQVQHIGLSTTIGLHEFGPRPGRSRATFARHPNQNGSRAHHD